MKEKVFVTTDNIFADLGLKNAEELRARSDLVSEVVSIIRKSDLRLWAIIKFTFDCAKAPRTGDCKWGCISNTTPFTIACSRELSRKSNANFIIAQSLSQKRIAEILKISAPKVSALMTGKINDFSNDTLVNYLTLLEEKKVFV